VSGGNNDIDRMSEIKEMSLLYEGFKHYFIVRFPQRPGALRLLVTEVLGPKDDITRFEYIKKTERERGPALIGIELNDPKDYTSVIESMRSYTFDFIEVNIDQALLVYLVGTISLAGGRVIFLKPAFYHSRFAWRIDALMSSAGVG